MDKLKGFLTIHGQKLTGALSPNQGLSGALSIAAPQVPYYTGAYEITPSSAIQTLETATLRMSDNVTINPIPSNYGLITWNGSVLTVS